jgi:transposase
MRTKQELEPFSNDLEGAAERFGKSTRTIRRWLQHHGLYQPNEKYRPGKTTKEIAYEIRRLDFEGLTQEAIAKKFNISQVMVGKIINNIAHRIELKVSGSAIVSVKQN